MSTQYLSQSIHQDNIDIKVNQITFDKLFIPRISVTQATSTTTPVSCNAESGRITTFTSTAAADTTTQFAVTNTKVLPTDTILIGINDYSGIYGTNGVPVIHAKNISPGTFGVTIQNVHPTNAFAGTFDICFILVHDDV
jgi:hypothetical protein